MRVDSAVQFETLALEIFANRGFASSAVQQIEKENEEKRGTVHKCEREKDRKKQLNH